jgi:electron transfer flavoprotein-quinone oxidoreductase
VTDVDVVVVGAGPAGSAAALTAARAGASVVLLERGPFPGSKNAYGGVVYGRVLDDVLPGWWEEVPVQRWVTRRSTMLLTPTQALNIDFRTEAWGSAPYNGCTTFRADFDSWLADKAVEAGAQLLTSTVATGLIREGKRVVGVRTDRADGELRAKVVIAADGVNSFLAKEAGLLPRTAPNHLTLGVKEVLGLPREVIDERFGVQGDHGVDIEILGCTRGVAGGGFVYTNTDSVSLGIVISLAGLAEAKVRPEELVAELKAHPAIAPLVKGAELKEYTAHLIPEGGYHEIPQLHADGLLVTGDAAGLTLAAGIWLEGVNFALGSGLAAGRAAAAAVARGDVSKRGLSPYRKELKRSFVLQDHKRLRHAPELVFSQRVQQHYPGMVADAVEGLFTVTNPTAKPALSQLVRRSAKKNGVLGRHLIVDAVKGARAFR